MMSPIDPAKYESSSLGRRIIRDIQTKKSLFWEKERQTRPVNLFHRAAREVPAYKDFLKKNHVDPHKIKTFKDFQNVPPVSKKDYLLRYPIEKLVWGGTLEKPLVWTSTSGSTGAPFYFPRGAQLDWQSSIIHEIFLMNSSYGTKGPIFIIIGFGMGVWIGGLITYKAFEIASFRSNLPISLLTTGINKKEIFHALKKIGPHCARVILAGYAPFIKDIVDEAPNYGINLKNMHVGILTAAEAYTEHFRDYLVKQCGIGSPYLDTLNVYGTADIGTMAWETPTAIFVRRLATKNRKLFKNIFSSINKTPTLAQYNPLFITFEASRGEILLSGNNTIPLIRYAVGDYGGVLDFNEIRTIIHDCHIDFEKEVRHAKIEKHIYELPFVYVYERVDLSTTLYGLQVYPETIRETLIKRPWNRYLTGKLTLLTKFDRRKNQFLEINLELRRDQKISASLKNVILKKIIRDLCSKNSEFRELYKYLGKRVEPKLLFWFSEHPLHFKPGIKQKWVKK